MCYPRKFDLWVVWKHEPLFLLFKFLVVLFQGWVSLSWVTSGRLWFPVITGLSSLPREWFLDLELPAPDLSSYFRLVTCIVFL